MFARAVCESQKTKVPKQRPLTFHLHHEDGSFQEYIALDADYLTVLPDDVDPLVMGPVLCASLTAYKICDKNIK